MKKVFDWAGIILLIVFLQCLCSCDVRSNKSHKQEYVVYNVPVYTTVYDIVYPDSMCRYTCTSHFKMVLGSYMGTNILRPKFPRCWPEWYDREKWEEDEPDIRTTAPIRLISSDVKYKKLRYKVR